jgi:adenylate cyclase
MGFTDWLLKPLGWLFARHPHWRDAYGRLVMWLGVRFYWALTLILALAGAWSLIWHPFDNQFAHDSFDLLMRHRPIAYPADPDVVVLDIDEASLAAMNTQYGRWPWPRQVLAEVGQQLERAHAQAVVFDILFADPDIGNPQSEADFDRYVQGSRSSFFPAVRLSPHNDAASDIALSLLKFAQPDPGVVPEKIDGRRTVAMITPYFNSIYESARVGTSNVYPDADNTVRWYPSYERIAGYRIPSLPFRVAELLHWPLPQHARNLINWPGGISPYRTFSFAGTLHAAKSAEAEFFKQFAGKVVVIGSTAADLGDIKSTPVDSAYPGIYVLATVLDNTKNARFLQPLNPWLIWCLELLMLGASALLFSYTNQALAIAKYFFAIPVVLFSISLLSVSISNWLVDLSVPTALVLAYFTIGKLFDTNVRDFIAGTGPFSATKDESAGKLQIACLPPSYNREQVLQFLTRRGSSIKLWEPESGGFGRHWMQQGWVLWQWHSGEAGSSDETALCWIDVPAPADAGGGFAVAEAIAAASKTMRETT